MEYKYSKGEWNACCLDKYPHYVFADGDGKAICRMLYNDPNEKDYENMEGIVTIEECRANARLIQAAPDLLEACRDLRQFIVDNIDKLPDSSEVRLKGLKAIVKATEDEKEG